MKDNKKSSGVLFINNKRTSDKAPDMTGSVELTKDLLKHLLDLANNGKPIKFKLAAWKREHDNAGRYLSILAEADVPRAQPKTSKSEDADLPF